ncbi:hypothetical protein ABEP17_20095, partial [Priestia flexa]|uniref:hypothetical protein n=1 Tax=Priestia flexa TaxID=86664 RepID=UPI003D28C83B
EEIHKTLRENVQKEDKTFEEVLLKNRAILQKQMETVQKIVESFRSNHFVMSQTLFYLLIFH